MSLQSKYAAVVARELRHHAVWEPGEPVHLGDYGILGRGRFSVHGNIKDDFEIEFEVARSRHREFAFRSDGVSESRSEVKGDQVGAAAELRVGFRSADALYVSSPSAWTEQIKGLARAVRPLSGNPHWRPEWMVVTRLYHASQAIILLSNSDDANVCLNLSADGVALAGDSSNDAGEQGSVALQLTGVRGPLFMGLHWVHKDLEDVVPRRRFVNRVLVLAGLGLVASGALTSWLVVGGITRPNEGVKVAVQGEQGGEEVLGRVHEGSEGDVLDRTVKEAAETKTPAAASKNGHGEAEETAAGAGSSGAAEESYGGGPETGGETDEPASVRVRIEANAPAEIRAEDGSLLGRTNDPKGIGLLEGVPTRLVVVADGFDRTELMVRPSPGAVFVAKLAERGSAGQGVKTPELGSSSTGDGASSGGGSSSSGSPTTGSPTTGSPTTGEPATGEPTTADPTSSGSPTEGDPVGGGAEPPRELDGGLPSLVWVALFFGLLGLVMVGLWVVRRFLAPLEPVRPEDVEAGPPEA